MPDDLEQFLAARAAKKKSAEEDAQRYRDEQLKRQKLFSQVGKAEWQQLQESVSTRAQTLGQGLQWNGTSLVLRPVAATFAFSGEVNGIIQNCRVIFGRIPYASYADESIIDPIVWALELETADGVHVLWSVDGRSTTSKDLAPEIIKELFQYHDEYEEAYGR